MKTALRVMALTAAMLTLSPVAHAADQNSGPGNGNVGSGTGYGGPGNGGSGKPWLACRDDAQTFCKGIQPGGGRIKDCLEDHYKELSDACYTLLKNGPPGPPPHSRGQGSGPGNGPPLSGGMQGELQGGPPDFRSSNGPPPHDDPGPPPDDRQ